jgi:hypothetical protein
MSGLQQNTALANLPETTAQSTKFDQMTKKTVILCFEHSVCHPPIHQELKSIIMNHQIPAAP